MEKIFKILSIKKKLDYYILFFFILLASILETLTIGAFFPLVSILIGDDSQKFFNIGERLNFLENSEIYINDSNLLSISLLVFIIIFIFKNLIVIYFNWYREQFNFSLRHLLSKNIFQIHMKKKTDFFFKKNTSDYTSQTIIQSAQAVESINALIYLANEIIVFLFIFILLLLVDYKITLGSILFFFLFMVPFLYFSKIKIKKWASQKLINEKDQLKNIHESFSMFKFIKVHSLERPFFDAYKNNNFYVNHLSKLIAVLSLMPRYFLEILTILLVSAIIFFFIANNQEPINSLPIIAVFLLSASRLVPSINKISNSIHTFLTGVPAINSISKEILKNKITLKEDKVKYEIFKKLDFKNISFSYKNKKNVFKNLNLTINDGDKIIIKGPSGVGKSSLIEVILGLRKINSGTCYLNGKKLNNYKLYKKIRFSYLPQSGYMIDDTIKNNILLNNKNLENKTFWKIIDICQLKNFILKLKKKENTVTGENGFRLSGGQKQRICIARALAGKPKFLILDESTNAIDIQTENLILKHLMKSYKDITLVMITHRKTNAKYFNKIIDMTVKKT